MPRNEGVAALQARLNAHGTALVVDGEWGPATQAALDHALPPPAVDPVLLAQIKRDEGLRLKSYQDTAGVWTIGYGHTGAGLGPGMVWSREHAEQVLVADLLAHNQEIADALPWLDQLDAPRRRVLQNMAFNLGVPGLLGFRNTLAAVRNGDYEAAAHGMAKSKWAGQVGSRAVRLVGTMRDGLDR